MAILQFSTTDIGDVISAPQNPEFPCMDTDYQELDWTFEIVKKFASFSDLQDYEKLTIPTFFANKTKNVTYGNIVENNMVLLSFKRKELVSPTVAIYAIEMSKEDV